MPTLVIDNVPAPLYDRIQHLARTKRRTPSDTVLEVLETAFRETTATYSAAPVAQAPFLTEEISPPCEIPWPEGTPVRAVHVSAPLPEPHDFPDED